MRLKYLFIYNFILIIIILGYNFYITLRTHKEDVLLLTEDKFILTDKLLRQNFRKRKHCILVTVSSCFTLVFNTFALFDYISLGIEAVFTIIALTYLVELLLSLRNYSFVQKQLIIKWVFDIVEDISKLNLSREDSEKLFDCEVRKLIKDKKLSVKKFNRVMRDLEVQFLEINRAIENN